MNKLRHIAALTLLALLTACGSSDMPIQHPDSYDYMTFHASTEKLATRANPYEAYDADRHPHTMGVFGFYDNNIANSIYNNSILSYDSSTKEWTESSRKRWNDYSAATTFDFLAYMPYTAGASLTRNANGSYTLSFPFAMAADSKSDDVSVYAAPVITNSQAAPIICSTPERKEGKTSDGDFTFDPVVNLKFDQTLTGYRLLFKLDPTMGAIRQFRIKRVSFSGELATSCIISRTYTWSAADNEWTSGGIQWTDIKRTTFTTDSPYVIPYQSHATDEYDDATLTAAVTATAYTQWGADLYTIPDEKFRPVISVTYDVEVKAENGSTVVTRKDVTSNITLNNDNFSNLATAGTAMMNQVRILIQPRYLYVLADDDAYAGHLLIE